MNSNKVLTILGVVATVIGAGASILSGVVNDKKMTAEVAAKVAEELNKKKG